MQAVPACGFKSAVCFPILNVMLTLSVLAEQLPLGAGCAVLREGSWLPSCNAQLHAVVPVSLLGVSWRFAPAP